MKPLLVGQAPSRLSDPLEPLSGASGRRLALLCGMGVGEFLDAFDRVNLLDRWPGRDGKGDHFPLAAARLAASRMARSLRGRRVVLVGARVASAFSLEAEPFRVADALGATVSVSPHPSGINHFWNDAANVRRARRFWRRLAQEAGRRPGAPPRS